MSKATKTGTDKVVKLQGKEYVLFEGLLEVSHSDYGMTGSETEVVQLPTEENGNTAIMMSTVYADDKKYTAIGDASPASVNKMIKPHIIRMAETRALGRAMRLLTGYGTVFEELGDIDNNTQDNSKSSSGSNNKSSSSGQTTGKKKESNSNQPKKATKAQQNKIQKDTKALGLSVETLYGTLGIEPDADGNITKDEASKAIKFLISDEAKQIAQGKEEGSSESKETADNQENNEPDSEEPKDISDDELPF